MHDILEEDQYWENVRERMENPHRHPWAGQLGLNRDFLFLDDLADEIREKSGHPVEALDEDELMDIIKEYTGIEPTSAKYNPAFFCVEYQYIEEGDP